MNILIDLADEPMTNRHRTGLHQHGHPTLGVLDVPRDFLPGAVRELAMEFLYACVYERQELRNELILFVSLRADEWLRRATFPTNREINRAGDSACDNCERDNCHADCEDQEDRRSEFVVENTDLAKDWFRAEFAAWMADGEFVIQERLPISSRCRFVEIGPGIVVPRDGYGALSEEILALNGRGATPERNWRHGARERLLRETGAWTLLPRHVRAAAGFP